MQPEVTPYLIRHRAQQAERHLALGLGKRGGDGFVFDRFDGRQWDPNELSRKFTRFIRRRNLPRVKFHDLRKVYGSYAYDAGVPLKDISESLGHSNINVTSAIYVHLMEDWKKVKATKLDAYMGSMLREARTASDSG